MLIFNRVFSLGFFALVMFGAVLPALFSSRTTEGPLLGILIIAGVVYMAGRQLILWKGKK